MTTYLSNAIAACERALNGESAFAPACQALGNVLQSMGRFQEALGWHTRALQSQPNTADVYSNLGRLYAQEQQWQQAIAAYEKAVAYNPDFAKAYWGMADIFSRLGKQPEALELWYQALTLEPHKATADAHCDLGNYLFKLDKLDQAVICYQRALDLNPSTAEAYHNLGEALMRLGQWEEAIACYRQATNHDPTPAWAYHKLGDALLLQNGLDEAIAAYRQAIHHNPEFPWSYRNLGDGLLRQGQWEDAVTNSHAVLALGREYPWAYTQLGHALTQLERIPDAIGAHQNACRLRGWHQCFDRGYHFTQDWFSHNIPSWEEHLQALAHQPHIHALEVGSFQGMSACWLLDTILTYPSATLTCIDLYFQPQFEPNILKTGALEKVTMHVGDSHALLSTLSSDGSGREYDLIYIDGCHHADYVYQDGMYAWTLLKINGIMIFDDYEWSDPDYPGHNPKLGIDQFLSHLQPNIEILHKAYQVILKKKSI